MYFDNWLAPFCYILVPLLKKLTSLVTFISLLLIFSHFFTFSHFFSLIEISLISYQRQEVLHFYLYQKLCHHLWWGSFVNCIWGEPGSNPRLGIKRLDYYSARQGTCVHNSGYCENDDLQHQVSAECGQPWLPVAHCLSSPGQWRGRCVLFLLVASTQFFPRWPRDGS